MAERQGFEPWIPCGIHAFQACAFSHSAISPLIYRCNFSILLHGSEDVIQRVGARHKADSSNGTALILVQGIESVDPTFHGRSSSCHTNFSPHLPMSDNTYSV